MKKDPNKYPKGLNRDRVERIIAHYESQSEEEAIAEADAASRESDFTLMRVPLALVAEVRQLVARRSRKSAKLKKSA
ncbi:MAG: hypothetical protein JNM86_04715 [Phycisphaerae bacterium]|nr:hypothetical protein [Phycisphaerae bacterium]MBN8599147.1 hypothetical protein [Planctomycetota bacterium]